MPGFLDPFLLLSLSLSLSWATAKLASTNRRQEEKGELGVGPEIFSNQTFADSTSPLLTTAGMSAVLEAVRWFDSALQKLVLPAVLIPRALAGSWGVVLARVVYIALSRKR